MATLEDRRRALLFQVREMFLIFHLFLTLEKKVGKQGLGLENLEGRLLREDGECGEQPYICFVKYPKTYFWCQIFENLWWQHLNK